jgi:hypothetical protein
MARLRVRVTVYGGNPTCDQLITGFVLLDRAGIVDLHLDVHADVPADHPSPSIVHAWIADRIPVAYDVEDGYVIDWEARNRSLETVDLCFKRSFNADLHASSPFAARFRPLGLVYHVTERPGLTPRWRTPESYVRSLAKRVLGRDVSDHWRRFEDVPHQNEKPSVLFAARLWDPRGENGEYMADPVLARVDRDPLNDLRVQLVRRLRSEFGPAFRGGLLATPYAREKYPDCVAGRSVTSRRAFLDLVRQSDICVATRGLFGSNGYKLGEYVAASRAVVSESLFYTVPGDFEAGRNYLPFDDAEQCVEQVAALLADRSRIHGLQVANYGYYHRYVRPDRMVLNTLLVALEEIEATDVPHPPAASPADGRVNGSTATSPSGEAGAHRFQ